MVRWRYCLVLALLLLLPTRTGSKWDEDDQDEDEDDEEDEDDQAKESDGEVEEEEDDDYEEEPEKPVATAHMRSSNSMVTSKKDKRALECFACAYTPEKSLKSCLDPIKYRVHTMTCRSLEDKCVTAVVPKGNAYESVHRGCLTGCLGTPNTTCCELNRCNSQAFALPEQAVVRRSILLDDTSKEARLRSSCAKPVPQTVLFFVTVLLLLQTVVKVAFV